MPQSIADYDAYQSAFHEAFRNELYGILDSLPLAQVTRAIDVPCGNGFYSRRLADRLGPTSQLTLADASEEYLKCARSELKGAKASVEIRQADAYALPFSDSAFDLLWCAQSLISLDAKRAIAEMHRITKPTGTVAILEVDEFHHLLLPWTGELEAALPSAIHAGSVFRYGDGVKLSPVRRLRAILKNCGFQSIQRRVYSMERVAPFDELSKNYLFHHFRYLRSLAYPNLPLLLKKEFDRLTDPDAGDSLYRLPDSEMVCLNVLYLASPT